MSNDTNPLQERLWEAVAEVRDQHPRVFNDAPTDDVIAAVLPIIAEMMERAWDEGSSGRDDPRSNPYRRAS